MTLTISKFLPITGINRILNPSQVQKQTGLKIYNTLVLRTLLHGFETRAIREQDKSRITSAEMKFMGRTAQYTWQDYKANDDILSELKIKGVVKEIQNGRNEWIRHVRRMYRDGQTATLNYEMSTMWETQARATPQKTSRLLVERKRSRGLEPCKMYDKDNNGV